MPKLRENINQLNSDIQAIKSAIVDSGVEIAEGTKIEEYADKVVEVYEAGKKAEWDAFWDNYQKNGTQTSYYMVFCGHSWDDTTFKPKYDIKPRSSASMYQCFYASRITDLVDILEKCGVILDTSNVEGSMQYAFGNGYFTRLPVIDVSKTSNSGSCFFANRSLKSIEKIIMTENTVPTSWFSNDIALENLTISGTIGQNGFDVQWSTKLSGKSIVSIIEALSSEKSGLTITLSKTAVNNMVFPITSGQTKITYDSWESLIATKSNWTISLV